MKTVGETLRRSIRGGALPFASAGGDQDGAGPSA
jgi:hypothetical protein